LLTILTALLISPHLKEEQPDAPLKDKQLTEK